MSSRPYLAPIITYAVAGWMHKVHNLLTPCNLSSHSTCTVLSSIHLLYTPPQTILLGSFSESAPLPSTTPQLFHHSSTTPQPVRSGAPPLVTKGMGWDGKFEGRSTDRSRTNTECFDFRLFLFCQSPPITSNPNHQPARHGDWQLKPYWRFWTSGKDSFICLFSNLSVLVKVWNHKFFMFAFFNLSACRSRSLQKYVWKEAVSDMWVFKIQPYMAFSHYYIRNPNHDSEHIYICFASLPQGITCIVFPKDIPWKHPSPSTQTLTQNNKKYVNLIEYNEI